MKHMLNLLYGLADTMSVLGTAPRYTYPSLGDRATDALKIRGDFSTVGKDLAKTTAKALKEVNGKIDNGTIARQG